MPINFNVKTKIKVNGKEYNSPEEMPPDVRSLYDKAMANRQSFNASTRCPPTRVRFMTAL
jgi:hypothetical protein